jgi:lipoate-protein ligase A
MKWRVMELGVNDAFTNMAIDEAICDSVRDGSAMPTIRFYRWKPSAVSIGCFQGMMEEVNVDLCKKLGIDVIRRRTGGGAVYHDYNGEVTYSVIAPLDAFPKGIRESYMVICGWVINGLSRLGINAYFAPINDIAVDGKKISGNAQTRRDGILLQHGTVLYDLDLKTMFSVLNVSKEKISDKMIKSAEERVTKVRSFADVPIDALYNALLDGFVEGKEYTKEGLSAKERSSAEALAQSVYRSDEWNFSR